LKKSRARGKIAAPAIDPMSKPFQLVPAAPLQFLLLFTNADSFYISARRALLYGWIAVGCSNAHQSIELYIKAILKLHGKGQITHDLVKLLRKYKSIDPYFTTILADSDKVEFLNQLSAGYISHRYGEAGAHSRSGDIITLLDEFAFRLRSIYLQTANIVSPNIYMPDKLQEEFLTGNKQFTKTDLTSRRLAQFGLPI
jgi:HEPN domain-containing protein